MKKKICAFFLSIVCIIAFCDTTVYATKPSPRPPRYVNNHIVSLQIGSSEAWCNGSLSALDIFNKKVASIKIQGRTMLPLRFLGENVIPEGRVRYVSDDEFITVTTKDKNVAKFKIGSSILMIETKSGTLLKKITLDMPPIKINGRVLVPIRAVAEGLGCSVVYQKLYNQEFVIISRDRMSKNDLTEELGMFTFTMTDEQKCVSFTKPGRWFFQGNELQRRAYYEVDAIISYKVVSKQTAQNFLTRTKADWEKEVGVTLESFSQTKINGNKTVVISYEDADRYKPFRSHMKCIVVSENLGFVLDMKYQNEVMYYDKDFEMMYKSIQFLK